MLKALGRIAQFAGLFGILLAIVEWYLPKSVKDRLEQALTSVWVFFVEAQPWRYVKHLWARRVQTVFHAAVHGSFVLAVWYLQASELGRAILQQSVAQFGLLVTVAAYPIAALGGYFRFHEPTAATLCAAESPTDYVQKAVRHAVTFVGFGVLAMGSAYLVLQYIPSYADLAVIAAGAAVIEAVILIVVLLASVAWIGIVSAIVAVARATEVTLRRLIESPKGPLLTVCGILIGLKTLIDILTSD